MRKTWVALIEEAIVLLLVLAMLYLLGAACVIATLEIQNAIAG